MTTSLIDTLYSWHDAKPGSLAHSWWIEVEREIEAYVQSRIEVALSADSEKRKLNELRADFARLEKFEAEFITFKQRMEGGMTA